MPALLDNQRAGIKNNLVFETGEIMSWEIITEDSNVSLHDNLIDFEVLNISYKAGILELAGMPLMIACFVNYCSGYQGLHFVGMNL